MMYKKVSHREHVLLRPAAYVGAVEGERCDTWCMGDVCMVQNNIVYVAGLSKLFDEIVSNACDHAVRTRQENTQPVKKIEFTIDADSGVLSVSNDGQSIPVTKHDGSEDMYIPELIFGHLLTSSNYDDDSDRIIGGQNGIGAKACNILSKWFEIEVHDSENKLKYIQKFEDNLSIIHPPTITKLNNKKSLVKITFLPDYQRFGLASLTNDMYRIFVKRAYDTAAITDSDVAVILNGEKLQIRSFEKYADLYIGPKADKPRVYEQPAPGWEVVAAVSDDGGFQQISFVNGVPTIRGGKHVDHVVSQICKKLCELISTRSKKSGTPKPQYVKDNLFVFVKATVPCPSFDSLAKDTLTTPVSKFKCKLEISDGFIDKLYKINGLVDKVVGLSGVAMEKELKKSDGTKKSTVNVPKLDDAEWAGTSKSNSCTLLLTEGDSAKASAIAGLAVVGRKQYGVFPLRGKLLNVRDVSQEKIASNEEISAVKKIMGLQTGKVYTDTSELRYGHIMLMTDADHDGSHIKGLIMNLFHSQWPSLLKVPGFMCSLLTPIVKVTASNKDSEVLEFYNIHEFEEWKDAVKDMKKYKTKYYKGLGTSTSQEAREWFKKMRKVVYHWNEDHAHEAMCKAFDKKRADDRKKWLQQYNPSNVIEYGDGDVGFDSFVDKDLIHFSNYDVQRSIPSAVDGFKPSQRKCLFGCKKRKLENGEIRVAQLAPYIAEQSCFHHGEASMQGTVIGMAQSFVGSGNNVPLLEEIGQFGTRLAGGTDWASPRYIHTRLRKITNTIFPAADEPILNYLNDDGISIEPEYYLPIIPMVLVNGANGIGTGYSTSVPSFQPKQVVEAIRKRIEVFTEHDDDDQNDDEHCYEDTLLDPWYSGFTGTIDKVVKPGDGSSVTWKSRGRVVKEDNTKIRVLELPIGYWTDNFKTTLTTLIENHPKEFKAFSNESTDTAVNFLITMSSPTHLQHWMGPSESNPDITRIEHELKMSTSKGLSINNIHLFNHLGQIHKYSSVDEIIKEFVHVRYQGYVKRKQHIINTLDKDLRILRNKVLFINNIISGNLVLHKRFDDDDVDEDSVAGGLEDEMETLGLERIPDSYSYLLSMPMSSITHKRKVILDAQLQTKLEELATVQNTSEVDMWKQDLDKLEAEL
jgi:DNA topoisomerase II